MADKPKVIVLCGSSKFVEQMAVTAWMLECDEGTITMGLHLLPWWYSHPMHKIQNHLAEQEGVAAAMDRLHLSKIDMTDEVFVINRGDYIGESTRREIKYARQKEIPIRWYMQDVIGRKTEELFQKRVSQWEAHHGG